MSIDIFIVKDVNEIDKYLCSMEEFINDYFCVCAKMKSFCSEEYENGFKEDLITIIFEKYQDIKMAKLLKQKIFERKI